MRRIALVFIAAMTAASSATAAPALVASTALGFSGATLTVRSSGIDVRSGSDHRTLTLKTADSRRIVKVLHDGGGVQGNNGINLYTAGDGRFLVLSEKDCLSIDAVKGTVTTCPVRPPCPPNPGKDSAFLGRFDWMNGFDRPHGAFRLGFRYLPFFDATCST